MVRNPPLKDFFQLVQPRAYVVPVRHITTMGGFEKKGPANYCSLKDMFFKSAAALIRAGAPRPRSRSTKPPGAVFAGIVTA